MRFAFDADQLLFRDAVRALLEKECPPAAVRRAWADPSGRIPELWAALTEMGVLGLRAPETAGGLGGTDLDLVLLLEEAGRAALPDPLTEAAAVVIPLLADAGDTTWLPALAAGDAIAGVGLAPHRYVTHAGADVVVLADGDDVHAVPGSQIEATPSCSVDGARRLSTVDWVPSPVTLLVGGVDGAAAQALAVDRGAVGAAAELLGLGAHLLENTAAYVKERQQFGVAVGSFQAVKHHLANALLALEFARPVVYRAAWSLSVEDPARSRDASMAKAMASDAVGKVAALALQCHGAIGYTVEYDLHLWLKRVWARVNDWGDPAWHRDRVGIALGV